MSFATDDQREHDARIYRRLAEIEAEHGERRAEVWIPIASTNTWKPGPGDMLEDAMVNTTFPQRILENGTKVPIRGIYEDDGSQYGLVRTEQNTAYVVGPFSQFRKVMEST